MPLKLLYLSLLILPVILRKNPKRNVEYTALDLVHINHGQPSPDEQNWRAEQKKNWDRQLRPQWWLVVISVFGVIGAFISVVILKKTLDATRESINQSRVIFEASQSPHVTPGTQNGRLAEFRNPDKPVVILHFFNSGPTPALNFGVVVSSNLSDTPRGSHLNRYKTTDDSLTISTGGDVWSTIAGNSGHAKHLPESSNPSKEQLADIRSGKLLFMIDGTYDYCDKFGRFRSESFTMRYGPPPIDEFIASPSPQRITSQMSDPPADGLATPGRTLIPLPRCKQPDEDNSP